MSINRSSNEQPKPESIESAIAAIQKNKKVEDKEIQIFLAVFKANNIHLAIPCFNRFLNKTKKSYRKEFIDIVEKLIELDHLDVARALLNGCFNQELDTSPNVKTSLSMTLVEQYITEDVADTNLILELCKFDDFHTILTDYSQNRKNAFNLLERLVFINKFQDVHEVFNCILKDETEFAEDTHQYKAAKMKIVTNFLHHDSPQGTLRTLYQKKSAAAEYINTLTSIEQLTEMQIQAKQLENVTKLAEVEKQINAMINKIVRMHYYFAVDEILQITNDKLLLSFLSAYIQKLSKEASPEACDAATEITIHLFNNKNVTIEILLSIYNRELMLDLIKNCYDAALSTIGDSKQFISSFTANDMNDFFIRGCQSESIAALQVFSPRVKDLVVRTQIETAVKCKRTRTMEYLFKHFLIFPEVDNTEIFLNMAKVIVQTTNLGLIEKFYQSLNFSSEFLKENIHLLIKTVLHANFAEGFDNLVKILGVLEFVKKEKVADLVTDVLIHYNITIRENSPISFMEAISNIKNNDLRKEFYTYFATKYIGFESFLTLLLKNNALEGMDFYFRLHKEFPQLNVFTQVDSIGNNILHNLFENPKNILAFVSFMAIFESQQIITNNEVNEILIQLFSQPDEKNLIPHDKYKEKDPEPPEELSNYHAKYNINSIIVHTVKTSDDLSLVKSLFKKPYIKLNYAELMYHVLHKKNDDFYNYFRSFENFYQLLCENNKENYLRLLLPTAYAKGKTEIVEILLKNVKSDHNLMEGVYAQKTIFEMACLNSDINTVQALLDNGYDVLNNRREVPIFFAFKQANESKNSNVLQVIITNLNNKNKSKDDLLTWGSHIQKLYRCYPGQKELIFSLIKYLLSTLKLTAFQQVQFLKEIYFSGMNEIKSNLLFTACFYVSKNPEARDTIFDILKLYEIRPELILFNPNETKNKSKKKMENCLKYLLEANQLELAKTVITKIQETKFYADEEQNYKIIQTMLKSFEDQENSKKFSEYYIFIKQELENFKINHEIPNDFNKYLNKPGLITKEILDKYSNDKTLLHHVVKSGNQSALKQILSIPDNNHYFLLRDNKNHIPLFYGANNELLIEKYKNIIIDEIKNSSPDLKVLLDDLNESKIVLTEKIILRFLFVACETGNHAAIISLLDYADANKIEINLDTNFDDFTLLNLACSYGYLIIVKILLEKGALPYPESLKSELYDALYIAILEEHEEIIKCLLEDMDETLIRHVIFTAVKRNDERVFNYIINNKKIISKYSVLEFADDRGNSLIHLACQYESSDILNILCNYPDVLNKRNRIRQKPIEQACDTGNEKIIKILLQTNKIEVLDTNVLRKIENYSLDVLVLLRKNIPNGVQKQAISELDVLILAKQDAEKINNDRKETKLDKQKRKEQEKTQPKVSINLCLFSQPVNGWLNERIPVTQTILAEGINTTSYYSAISLEVQTTLNAIPESKMKFEQARTRFAIRKVGKNGIKPLTSSKGLKFKTIILTDEKGNSLLDTDGKEIKFRTNAFYELKIGNSEERLWGIRINNKDNIPLIYFIGYLARGLHKQGSILEFNSIKEVKVIVPSSNAKNELTYKN